MPCPGEPYTGAEWDCAAASIMATSVLLAPFDQRRFKLVTMLVGMHKDGFFQLLATDDL